MTQQKQQTKVKNENTQSNTNLIIIMLITLVLAVVISFLLCKYISPSPKIAYVDTAKLMVGFNEAARIDRELKEEDDKWKKKLKELKDSLAAHLDLMGKEYDNANLKRKKDLQTMLSIHNQNVNNFREANQKKMENLKQEKLQTVFSKMNLFMSEYGKKHNYSIIFGTVAGGSILFGNQKGYEITSEVIAGLNERYK